MREIKFRYFFTNHAPVVFSLLEIEALAVSLPIDMGKISHRVQYTGMKDANGVEIYEGDIVTDEDCLVAAVKFCTEKLALVAAAIQHLMDLVLRRLEVIGSQSTLQNALLSETSTKIRSC